MGQVATTANNCKRKKKMHLKYVCFEWFKLYSSVFCIFQVISSFFFLYWAVPWVESHYRTPGLIWQKFVNKWVFKCVGTEVQREYLIFVLGRKLWDHDRALFWDMLHLYKALSVGKMLGIRVALINKKREKKIFANILCIFFYTEGSKKFWESNLSMSLVIFD